MPSYPQIAGDHLADARFAGRVSLVVPTRNEAGNIHELHRRIAAALDGVQWELVFVDDSDDATADTITEAADVDPRVRLVRRDLAERVGGLSGAVLAGVATCSSEVVVVMDADLQHPPESLPRLIAAFADAETDIAVGSRRVDDGSSVGLDGPVRRAASSAFRLIAQAAVPRSRGTTDPLSGFFGFRRRLLDGRDLQPEGYKILLEILAQTDWRTCVDVGFTFAPRADGQSKATLAEGRRFLRHVRSLRARRASTTAQLTMSVLAGDAVPVRPLRIMIFTSEAPPVVSGIAACIKNLDTTLTARGHQVDLVTREHFPRFMRDEIRLSAFVFHWPRFRRTLGNYDIINVHGPVPTMSEVFLLLARTLRPSKRPTIAYTHHSDLAIPGLARLCGLYNLLTRFVVRTADVVLVSSQAYASKFERLPLPIEVIPWGVDVDGKVLPRAESSKPERLRVLFVGQLRPYKGLAVLLEAVRTLGEVEVTVIGDGPERARLEQLSADSPLDNVTFRGRVSDTELWLAYSEHDVIVLPSLTSAEAYGLVLAEGMAAGCAPVASDLPGVREVVGDSGLVVRPGDAGGLRAALAGLADDRQRLAELAAASIERAEALTIHANGARHEEVFLRTVAQRQVAV